MNELLVIRLTALATALLIASLFAAAEASVTVIAVATQGQTAPGTGGATFNSFDEPMANTAGDVAFFSDLSASQFGVFLFQGAPASLELVALRGQSVPGVGTLSSGFDGPAISGDGAVFFVVRTITAGVTTAALLKREKGNHRPPFALLKQGDRAPGTNNGVFVTFDDIAVNAPGSVAVIADYTEDGGSTIKTGVFLVVRPGTVVAIALSGDVLPGTGGGTIPIPNSTFSGDIDGPWINDNGVVAFAADTITGGTGGFEGSVFARQPGGPLSSFVLIGDPIPASCGTVQGIQLSRPGLSNLNQLVFNLDSGSSCSPETFMATKTLGGSIALCVADLSSAPGTTGTFDGFSHPAINGAGQLVFNSDISGDATNDRGVFVCKNGTVDHVVLRGDSKPGGGSWGFDLEEESIGGKYVVFDDENGSPPGVFRAKLP